MRKQTVPFSFRFIKHTLLFAVVAINQAFSSFAICVSEPGHIKIEFADSACCNSTIPSQDRADELVESEAANCADCVDHEITNRSLLNRGGHSILNHSSQQNTVSGKWLVTDIIWNTPISFYYRVTPDQNSRCQPTLEKSSPPLRC
jgi:hypothetical protein